MPFKNIENRRQWQKDRRARRYEYLKDKVCHDCGTNEHLDLHHLDKSTKIDSWIWLWGQKRIDEELSKCITLCRSCHTKRHNAERRKPVQHGTSYAYNVHKCRCDLCKTATSERLRKYRIV